MRRLMTIAAGISHDDRNEAVLAGVDASRADTAAGRHTGDDQRVDTVRRQRRRQRGTEKRTRILLGLDQFVVTRLEPLSPFAEGITGLK